MGQVHFSTKSAWAKLFIDQASKCVNTKLAAHTFVRTQENPTIEVKLSDFSKTVLG